MSSIQHVRRRMKSVKNINQITKAMEMVAASKLRRAQAATLASRIYAIAARQALSRIRAVAGEVDYPLFQASAEVAARLVIVFTSDRGLAGAYNANVIRALLRLLEEQRQEPVRLIVIGAKGAQVVRRLKAHIEVVGLYTNWPHRPRFEDITPIAQTAIGLFTAGQVGRVTALYTDFVSLAAQKVVARDVLPVASSELQVALRSAETYLVEPDPLQLVGYIVPRLLAVQLYQAALEASASEQAARMLAMRNASDNAADLLQDLTLEYNGARQAAVTAELAEISAGAQAVL